MKAPAQLHRSLSKSPPSDSGGRRAFELLQRKAEKFCAGIFRKDEFSAERMPPQVNFRRQERGVSWAAAEACAQHFLRKTEDELAHREGRNRQRHGHPDVSWRKSA